MAERNGNQSNPQIYIPVEKNQKEETVSVQNDYHSLLLQLSDLNNQADIIIARKKAFLSQLGIDSSSSD